MTFEKCDRIEIFYFYLEEITQYLLWRLLVLNKLGEERQLVLENNKMLEAGKDVDWVDMTDDLLPKINMDLRSDRL